VQEHLERRYSIRVVTWDTPAPLIGNLDGLEIAPARLPFAWRGYLKWLKCLNRLTLAR
jgi:hypothetical protein